MGEVWKDVAGFEGRYIVSNLGHVVSLSTGKIKNTKLNNRGYVQVHMWDGKKDHMKLIHRIVAEAFIENPHGYAQVNHKDENKQNNSSPNLEWCDNLYNRHYGTGYQRSVAKHDYRAISLSHSKEVIQYKNGVEIARYLAVKDAERATGINECSIRLCCYGRYGQAGGDKWEYAV